MIPLHIYSGAGNNFVVADGRKGFSDPADVSQIQEIPSIVSLCTRYSTDGLMVLADSDDYDFSMIYYNPDGSGGMMCGNGGRCIVAFAADLGVPHRDPSKYVFMAPDGVHEAQILSETDGVKTVRLKMKDVSAIEHYDSLDVPVESKGYFLDTGTRHYVRFISDVDDLDIETEGKAIRWARELGPIGANVNFVTPRHTPDGTILDVRTFEKGVERETLACGTGIVASAIAAWKHGIVPTTATDRKVSYAIKARGGSLSVDFIPAEVAVCVYLTGPACEI